MSAPRDKIDKLLRPVGAATVPSTSPRTSALNPGDILKGSRLFAIKVGKIDPDYEDKNGGAMRLVDITLLSGQNEMWGIDQTAHDVLVPEVDLQKWASKPDVPEWLVWRWLNDDGYDSLLQQVKRSRWY